MRKKILSLGIIGVLLIMLFVLTGCGDKTTTNTNKSSNNNESSNVNQENRTGIAIKNIVQKFTDGLAVVEDSNENQYVIDENGVVIYENTTNKDIYISNGYISVGNYIYDNKGNEVTHNENKDYKNVSKSGFVAVTDTTEDISGTKSDNRVEDLKGNVISDSYGVYDVNYLFEDYFVAYDHEKDKDILINAKTKETQNLSDVLTDYNDKGDLPSAEKIGEWYLIKCSGNDDWYAKNDFSKAVSLKQYFDDYSYKCDYFVLEKYIIGKGTQGGNSDLTKAFDLDGNVVKDFSEIGGILSIEDYNNTIYAISGTGYIYTMDENFNYIKEPEKSEYNSLIKTEEGIWGASTYRDGEESKEKLVLLNDKLEETKEITGIKYFSSPKSDGIKFMYENAVNSSQIYNIKTGKMLEIYK